MSHDIDMEKVRRENIRWHAMVALNAGSPDPVAATLILSALQSVPGLAPTQHDLKRALDYLEERGLVRLDKPEGAPWIAHLTRHGVDVVEYTVECDAGIARPKKYW